MWTHLKSLNETDNVTVFLTSHYMDEADRVFLIRHNPGGVAMF